MASELTEIILENTPRATLAVLAERASEFSSPMEMKMTATALSTSFRAAADNAMDDYWGAPTRRDNMIADADGREVIIGAGYHAAVYSAIRVALGYRKPLVLERGRAGGAFASAGAPTFFLNSRNRPGRGGVAGDRRASLNYLPGAPIQPANFSASEYQTDADMAFAIRLTLAECADVVTGVTVESVGGATAYPNLRTSGGNFNPARIIDARGLGDPTEESKPESGMYTFPDFRKLMTRPFPLKGVRTVAVLGGGDSARCAVEALIGVGPQSSMTIPVLDRVERIDWFGEALPNTCEEWRQQVRGRYQAIGPSLRPDRFGERLINVVNGRAYPVGIPGATLINGRSYDMTILCTGSTTQVIDGLDFGNLYTIGRNAVARQSFDYNEMYRVGPHASIPFSDDERASGIADISNNRVAMFRTGPKTAALAATLPSI